MKTILFAFVSCLFFNALQSQSLLGAWENVSTNEEGLAIKNVVIFSEGFQVATWYDANTGAFISTNGGSWELDSTMLIETVEFDTKNPDRVGTQVSFEIMLTQDLLKVKDGEQTWKRLDNGTPGALAGAWLMSGRKTDGTLRQRDTNRPRKTMKILSGSRFQWIAYNTETKQFMGTGGGTYTTVDGKYTENIKFFSRDNTRVGASLEFDFDLKNGDWHHSGFSSKGAPLYEIWSLRKQ
ncbi:membrane or secreted protein [Flagellimonas algicola]|uniref:Membrane or secreted protein n=1 Tax=Flagellimonas algicola TaxID=2583815 RepID=A0ABY2WKW6_9FLAO|nr:membrane or secreted protein [Allomuricauda algicola]TMU55290.1 membrane or secreted protein [Allomuricauda algicola]